MNQLSTRERILVLSDDGNTRQAIEKRLSALPVDIYSESLTPDALEFANWVWPSLIILASANFLGLSRMYHEIRRRQLLEPCAVIIMVHDWVDPLPIVLRSSDKVIRYDGDLAGLLLNIEQRNLAHELPPATVQEDRR